MRIIKFIFLGIIACGTLVFSLLNRHMVQFQWNPFVDTEFGDRSGFIELPMFLYVILILSIGIAIGVFLEWRREAKHRSEIKTQKAEVGKLRGEVNRLYSERSH